MSWSACAPVGAVGPRAIRAPGGGGLSGPSPSPSSSHRALVRGVRRREREPRRWVGVRSEDIYGRESESESGGRAERDRYSKFSLHVAEVGCYITSMDDGTYSMKFLLPNTDLVIKSVTAAQLAALHPVKAEDQGHGEAAEAVKNLAVPTASKKKVSLAGAGGGGTEATLSPGAKPVDAEAAPAGGGQKLARSGPLPPVGEYRTVEGSEELDAVLSANADGITVLEVGMTWCRPCMGFEPKYKRAARENEDLVFLRINGNVSEDTKFLCKHLLKVRATPCFYFFHKRGMISSHSGANEGRLKAAILQAKEMLVSNEMRPAEPLLDNYAEKLANEQHRAAEEAALAAMRGRQGD